MSAIIAGKGQRSTKILGQLVRGFAPDEVTGSVNSLRIQSSLEGGGASRYAFPGRALSMSHIFQAGHRD